MEFNRFFNIFTVAVIVILLAVTFVSACFAVTNRANGNLGVNVTVETTN